MGSIKLGFYVKGKIRFETEDFKLVEKNSKNSNTSRHFAVCEYSGTQCWRVLTTNQVANIKTVRRNKILSLILEDE